MFLCDRVVAGAPPGGDPLLQLSGVCSLRIHTECPVIHARAPRLPLPHALPSACAYAFACVVFFALVLVDVVVAAVRSPAMLMPRSLKGKGRMAAPVPKKAQKPSPSTQLATSQGAVTVAPPPADEALEKPPATAC